MVWSRKYNGIYYEQGTVVKKPLNPKYSQTWVQQLPEKNGVVIVMYRAVIYRFECIHIPIIIFAV